nr:hypothetical protein [Teredinibacter turnerae]
MHTISAAITNDLFGKHKCPWCIYLNFPDIERVSSPKAFYAQSLASTKNTSHA